MAISGAINRQNMAISGAINSQKGRQILYRVVGQGGGHEEADEARQGVHRGERHGS